MNADQQMRDIVEKADCNNCGHLTDAECPGSSNDICHLVKPSNALWQAIQEVEK